MLKTKCSQCLGCNKLGEPEFKEIYRCANFAQGKGETKDEHIAN